MQTHLRCLLVSALALTAAGRALAQEYYWEVSPFLTLTRPEVWKLNIRLQVDNFEDENITGVLVHSTKRFDAESGSVFFPLVPATASSQTFIDRFEGVLRINDRIVDEEPEIYVNRGEGKPLPAGTFLVEFAFGPIEQMGEMSLNMTTYGRSWETRYDEEAAARVDWPDELPPVLQTVFEPELYVNQGPFGPYNLRSVRDKVMEWTDGNPKALPPAQTAKWIAIKVAEAYRPINRGWGGPGGESAEGLPISAFSSFVVDGPEFALEQGRGSRFNLPVLLVACYRAAGIPARIVIGYDFARTLNASRGPDGDRLRCWVEFALYDEHEPDEKRRLTWVPVDIVKLQASSAWTQPFERPLKYFGTHDELDEVIPIAFHFTPYWAPGISYGRYFFETVDARRYYEQTYGFDRRKTMYAPSLWSWNVMPAPPRWAGQWIDFMKDSPMSTMIDPLPAEVKRGNPPRRRR